MKPLPLNFKKYGMRRIYGGPYREKPSDMLGVKMAEELNLPCEIDIPTKDFGVPDVDDLRKGLIIVLALLKNNTSVYVGCAGGLGRTGLFMACLVKIFFYKKFLWFNWMVGDPVKYVRKKYDFRAIETKEQEAFVKNFDVKELVKIFNEL